MHIKSGTESYLLIKNDKMVIERKCDLKGQKHSILNTS